MTQSSERQAMLYAVSAQPRIDETARLWRLLNDGTIARQEPDGREIIASMKRAKISGNKVEWSETCYCNPPLNHERSTIYNQFFDKMTIVPLEAPIQGDGQPFWDYLRRRSERPQGHSQEAGSGSRPRYAPLRIL